MIYVFICIQNLSIRHSNFLFIFSYDSPSALFIFLGNLQLKMLEYQLYFRHRFSKSLIVAIQSRNSLFKPYLGYSYPKRDIPIQIRLKTQQGNHFFLNHNILKISKRNLVSKISSLYPIISYPQFLFLNFQLNSF